MAENRAPLRRALISVSDKDGLADFARGLVEQGVEILSTGGTATMLQKEGIAVTEVSSYTGFPEMMDGRVKTLHPKVHGGILFRRDLSSHRDAATRAGIRPIDLVVVNLYPFAATVAKPDCSLEEAIENIDIGGPTLIRAAAKNHQHVTVVTDPADYPAILAELAAGGIDEAMRYGLAAKAFAHTANYDGAIANYLTGRDKAFPDTLTLQVTRQQDLRYGENPHQQASFYRDLSIAPGLFASYRQLQGKELSYNNIADADAAWECVRTFETTACVIVKHANPCGVAVAESATEAYRRAFATDPVSAFGGIIAFNREVDIDAAQAILGQFVEVLIAPSYNADALAALAAKGNIRVLQIPLGDGTNAMELKRVGGGLLVQTPDLKTIGRGDLKIVTQRQPSEEELLGLLFAWKVVRFVKSNAIIFCGADRTLGIGAGQMSRVDSTRIAVAKAKEAGLDLAGAVVASDAFFPFRDGVDVLAESGAKAIIQPGGSMRDTEVIAAADEHGLAMVFSGVRHFRH